MGKNSVKISQDTLINHIKHNNIEAITHYLDSVKRPKKLNDLLINTVYQRTPSIEMINLLLKHGGKINYETKYGESLLSVASNNGHFSLVRQLMDLGANKKFLHWSPLMFTLIYGTTEQIEALLLEGADVSQTDRWKRTPLLLAIQCGDIEKASLLIQAGASLDERGHCGKRPITYAIQHDHIDMVKWLVESGIDPNSKDDHQITYLMESAEYGAYNCLCYFLDKANDIHALDFVQSTALDYCIDIRCVKKLVEAGADINRINGEGNNLLMYAAEDNNITFLKELLALGADPNTFSTGEIALHKAMWSDNLETIKLLLDAGSNPNQQDVDDWTPLHAAKSIEAAEALLKAGADKTLADMCGTTPEKNSLCPKAVRKFIANW